MSTPSSVFDPIRFWGSLEPARTAVVDRSTGRRWSYAELDAEADRWAAALHMRGVEPGDRVATLASNRIEQILLFLACGRIRCALVPLNWRLSAAELAPILADADPRLLYVEDRFAPLASGAGSLSNISFADAVQEAALAGAAVELAAADPDDAWLILYTSGSTGAPKGAILPRRQIESNARATTVGWRLGASDVAPISTPLFHTGGWNVFATPLWSVGGAVVLIDGFEPGDFLDTLHEECCTVALTVPTQLLMLAESPRWGAPLPHLRHFISGGAPCPPSLAERARAAGYRFREGYGLTECGPNCFATSDELALRHPGSVGRPAPYLRMRLAGERGEDVQPGEIGELLLRGPQLFGGYLRRADLTREAMTADGWLRTGDLARLGAEGVYYICGRRKEMYISGGENVFPGEVEAALLELAAVVEAVVVGRPDPKWGEVGHAFVVLRSGVSVTDREILQFLRQRLASYKVPKALTILDAIPRLGSGKPDRAALRTAVGLPVP